MKHIVRVFALMTFLIAAQQKAFSQTELKIHDGTVNPICKDSTKAPKDLMSFATAIQENKVSDFFQPGVSNVDWANKVVEGFNYRSAERLGMEPITIGQLMKMMKDTAHCKIKYLNVQKDLLLNSGVDPETNEVVWQKMKEDAKDVPYVTYTSPFNSQEAVIAKWVCRCNPQADLRESKPEEKVANNDDIYFTPDENDGISESSDDATANAKAEANATVNVNYIPQGATNYQQYSQQCGCYQSYYPPQQQYCYSNYPQWFVGIQFIFSFQWGGQTYYAYDPQDEQVQQVVNNYNNTYVYNTTIINNNGTSDTTTTDTGGATNGTDGDTTDTGGASDGSGLADNGGGTNGSGKQESPNHVVETLESNPIVHNVNGVTASNQSSNLSSNVGNSFHNVETLDANPVLANVNGSDHHVATLSGNGNPISNVSGVNHNVTNLDPNPTLNTVGQNVFDVNHSQGLTYNQQQNGNGYTASAGDGTFDPTNYSQGVKTFSYNGQQLQTNQTQSQDQVLGYTANGTPVYANVGNGYFNNNSDYNTTTIAATPNLLTTKGDVRNYTTIPNQTLFNNSVNNQNTHLFSNNGNGIGTTSAPSRNLIFNQAPNFNLSQSGSRTTFQAGRATF